MSFKRFSIFIFVILALATAADYLIAAETKMHTKTINAGEGGVFLIPEIGAIISKEDKNLTVLDVLPIDSRPADYKEVDFQNGDELIMLNGKKLKSIEDIQKLYGNIKEGDDVKFGIRRDKRMMMVSYKRGSDDAGGQMQIMTFDAGDDAEGTYTQSGGNFNVNIEGDIEGMLPLIELGIMLGEEDNAVKVLQVFPNAKDIYPDCSIEKGDIVSKLNGKKITTSAEFQEVYSEIKAGETIDLFFVKDGHESAVSIKKPSQGMKMITTDGE